jgi:hemerythrin-like domain-containing protein
MPNAITMLKSDHATVKRLLRELNATTDRAVKAREQLVSEIQRELKTHAQIEEEVFYPALPALAHANPKSPEFEAKAKVLQDLIEHHVKEEEGQMFVAARKVFDDEQLRELGDLMQARRESIEAMWSNPLTRPMKKIQAQVHKMLPTKVKTAKATAIARGMNRDEAR